MSEDGLEFEFSQEDDGSPIVLLRGELDMTATEALETALRSRVGRETQRFVVDAGDLKFADSSAIALLVRLANMVDHVEIRHPSQLLREVIKRMGLSDRLRLEP
jgi:anti-anti-sigma factor